MDPHRPPRRGPGDPGDRRLGHRILCPTRVPDTKGLGTGLSFEVSKRIQPTTPRRSGTVGNRVGEEGLESIGSVKETPSLSTPGVDSWGCRLPRRETSRQVTRWVRSQMTQDESTPLLGGRRAESSVLDLVRVRCGPGA